VEIRPLKQNGFEVVNLRHQGSNERLIEAVREHRPDIVGMSGLVQVRPSGWVANRGRF